ncbi:hypothetical protein SPLA10_PHROGS00163 [Salmonella phage SPLA10]|nr:hypothetical protein SPLA10_PHROGS00163 [Salmonella phage SPLA10]
MINLVLEITRRPENINKEIRVMGVNIPLQELYVIGNNNNRAMISCKFHRSHLGRVLELIKQNEAIISLDKEDIGMRDVYDGHILPQDGEGMRLSEITSALDGYEDLMKWVNRYQRREIQDIVEYTWINDQCSSLSEHLKKVDLDLPNSGVAVTIQRPAAEEIEKVYADMEPAPKKPVMDTSRFRIETPAFIKRMLRQDAKESRIKKNLVSAALRGTISTFRGTSLYEKYKMMLENGIQAGIVSSMDAFELDYHIDILIANPKYSVPCAVKGRKVKRIEDVFVLDSLEMEKTDLGSCPGVVLPEHCGIYNPTMDHSNTKKLPVGLGNGLLYKCDVQLGDVSQLAVEEPVKNTEPFTVVVYDTWFSGSTERLQMIADGIRTRLVKGDGFLYTSSEDPKNAKSLDPSLIAGKMTNFRVMKDITGNGIITATLTLLDTPYGINLRTMMENGTRVDFTPVWYWKLKDGVQTVEDVYYIKYGLELRNRMAIDEFCKKEGLIIS